VLIRKRSDYPEYLAIRSNGRGNGSEREAKINYDEGHLLVSVWRVALFCGIEDDVTLCKVSDIGGLWGVGVWDG
jgi:hypothetical protein